MPIYISQCNKCQKEYQYIKTVDKRDETPVCCDQPTKRREVNKVPGYVDNPLFHSSYKHLY